MYTLIDEDNNWVISSAEDESLFPVWSAQEFAALCIIDEWEECSIKAITIEQFEDDIIDEKNEWLVNVHGVKDKTGFIVTLDEFAKDLSDEMRKYH